MDPITLPTPAPAPEPAPAPAPEPTPAAAPEAAPAPKAAKPRDPIADRIQKALAPKDEPAPTPAPKADEKPLPSGDKDLDAEIETVAKDLSPAQKKAFTHKTYELRDMKRKLADAEAKGKNTESLETKIADLEAKLAATPTQTTDPKEVETYKEQVKAAQERADTLAKELEIAAIERTDEFKRAVTQPKKAIEERIAKLAEKYEIAPKQLINALYGSPEDQVEAADKLSEPEKVKFYNDALKLVELDERAEILRTNAAEANVKISAKREAETKSQREQSARVLAEAHKQNWKALREQLPIFNPVDGTDDVSKNWNSHIEKAEKWSGETDFTSLDAAKQSETLQHASVFPMLVGALNSKDTAITALQSELSTVKEALAKFQANKAGAEVSPRDDGSPKPPQQLGAKGTANRIQAALRGGRG